MFGDPEPGKRRRKLRLVSTTVRMIRGLPFLLPSPS